VGGGVVWYTLALSHASPAPLPSSAKQSGNGPAACDIGPLQMLSGHWTITFSYTPLNGSASVTVLNADKSINNYKLIPTSTPGTITVSESITQPVYIQCYAADWSINVE
ncbi:MAG TPA: hypothetical protein VFT53_05675, partial [Candidatus Saccharimonadales bacterium]|nr:hypothetical protein [Candidatus Saccharimonadales bacterium]